GGAGFIGSHLTERLVKDGVGSVVALDSLEFGRWSNLGSVEAGVEKVTADLSDLTFEEMGRMLRGVEVLFHLAAQKHTHRVDSAERVLAANVMATERLFRAAAAAGVRRVVFASSLFAYGRMVGEERRSKNHATDARSEEHTSELQSRENLVCRLLLEKKKSANHI